MYKTPFGDAVGPESVPKTGSKGGKYDYQEIPDTPGRDGGFVKELYRDTTVSKSPSTSGPLKTPFKDAVD